MRRVVAVLVAAVAILGLSVPHAWAQAAAPPAPKVTIGGYLDFVTSMYMQARSAADDITNAQDHGWYSRNRGRLTITGEIGRVKAVTATELDFVVGRQEGTAGPGGNSGIDLDFDEKAQLEIKWLYLETPITGAGSLMPFIPVETLGRFGGIPARGHDYKPGILVSGDLPAVELRTTWAPNLRTTLTFIQIQEALDRVTAPGGRENWAIAFSPELDVFKGLTVKPTYAYVRHDDLNRGTANLGTEPYGGVILDKGETETRHTLGLDVRWTAGPFSLAPTLLFQWGETEIAKGPGQIAGAKKVDIITGLVDVIAGFRTGPLTIELRGVYTPGNKASDNLGQDDIHVYRAINPGFVYFAGWAELLTSGIDYNATWFPGQWGRLGVTPSYDRYGRIIVAAAVDYALTPALVFHFVPSFHWTAEKVDIDGKVDPTRGITPSAAAKGDKRFWGQEYDAGFTYRFAPNIAFDLIGAWLIPGGALDRRDATGAKHDAEDVWRLSARLAVTF